MPRTAAYADDSALPVMPHCGPAAHAALRRPWVCFKGVYRTGWREIRRPIGYTESVSGVIFGLVIGLLVGAPAVWIYGRHRDR